MCKKMSKQEWERKLEDEKKIAKRNSCAQKLSDKLLEICFNVEAYYEELVDKVSRDLTEYGKAYLLIIRKDSYEVVELKDVAVLEKYSHVFSIPAPCVEIEVDEDEDPAPESEKEPPMLIGIEDRRSEKETKVFCANLYKLFSCHNRADAEICLADAEDFMGLDAVQEFIKTLP